MSRLLDLVLASFALILFSPLFIILAVWIKLDSPGNAIYKQLRVGQYGREFWLYKFRSMKADADKDSLLTFGEADNRITTSGKFIRKYKMDELPQLFNVLSGEMSIVGPRPEVKKYVDLYNDEQKTILKALPGITDYASIVYYNEAEILAKQSNPEAYYINTIMPDKIKLNQKYIQNPSLLNYFRVILFTVKAILK